jgi:hypothetical protein
LHDCTHELYCDAWDCYCRKSKLIFTLLLSVLYRYRTENQQCLVGYTPFYAAEPVTTCKQILKWEQFLDIPEEVAATLSGECLDFMLSLIIGSEERCVIALFFCICRARYLQLCQAYESITNACYFYAHFFILLLFIIMRSLK